MSKEDSQKYDEGLKAIHNAKVAHELDDASLEVELTKYLNYAALPSGKPDVFLNGNKAVPVATPWSLKKVWDALDDKRVGRAGWTADAVEYLAPLATDPFRGSPRVDEALDTAAFGYFIAKSTAYGVGCAATAFSVNPLAIPLCYEFFVAVRQTAEQGTKLTGNRQRSRANQVNSLNNAVCELNSYLFEKYSTTPGWEFDVIDQEKFKHDFSSVDASSFVTRFDGNSRQEGFDTFMVDHLMQSTDFSNRREMRDFFGDFHAGMGDLYKESIERSFEIESTQRANEVAKQQELNMLYSSVGQLLGAIAPQYMGKTEARVFNALMPVGMQLAVGAPLGPIGWTAIGVSVASSLMQSSGPSGDELILKALAQIQKQLNVIIAGIEQIQKTQFEILQGLNDVFQSIQDLKKYQEASFKDIKSSLKYLENRINEAEIQKFNNSCEKYLQFLTRILVDGESGYSTETVRRYFDELGSLICLELNDHKFTRYAQTLDVHQLKKEVFFETGEAATRLVSLYDSIGLIPALANHDPSSMERSMWNGNVQVTHPVHFYKMTGVLVDWLARDRKFLARDAKAGICKTLLKVAEGSQALINSSCSRAVIDKKVRDYRTETDKILKGFYESLSHSHRIDFEKSDNLKSSCTLYSMGKNYVERENATFNFDPAGLASTENSYANFFDKSRRFDDMYLNLLRDLGIVVAVDCTVTRKLRKSTGASKTRYGMKKGSLVGRVAVKLKFNPDNAAKGLKFPEFEIGYEVDLLADKVKEETTQNSSGGHHGGERYWTEYSYKLRTATANNGFGAADWETPVAKAFDVQDRNFHAEFPGLKSRSFHEFLEFLIERWFQAKKIEYVDRLFDVSGDSSLKEAVDVCAIPLMVLSKLNQVVTSDVLTPYVIDYGDEIFTYDDFKRAFEYYAGRDYRSECILDPATMAKTKNLFQEISQGYLALANDPPETKRDSMYFLGEEGEIHLNPERYIDLICILVKRRLLNTVSACQAMTRDLEPQDCEPYLADTINVLKLFRDEYLSA